MDKEEEVEETAGEEAELEAEGELLNHFLPDSQSLQNIGGLSSTSVGGVRFL